MRNPRCSDVLQEIMLLRAKGSLSVSQAGFLLRRLKIAGIQVLSLIPFIASRGMFVIVIHNRLFKDVSPAANYNNLIAALLGNHHNTLLTVNLRLCANVRVTMVVCLSEIHHFACKHIRCPYYKTVFVLLASSPWIFLFVTVVTPEDPQVTPDRVQVLWCLR